MMSVTATGAAALLLAGCLHLGRNAMASEEQSDQRNGHARLDAHELLNMQSTRIERRTSAL